MRYLLILLSISITPFSTIYATASGSTAEKTLKEVSILLNHQQFKKATEIFSELKKSTQEITITRDIDYESFIVYLQQLGWEGSDYERTKIIQGRLQYHPKEKDYASLLVRQKGIVYATRCNAKTPYFLDKVDKAMCQLYREKIPQQLKKNLAKKTIAELTTYVMSVHPVNPQNISDLGNLIGIFMDMFPKEDVKKYSEDLVLLGMYLTDEDQYWTNGYILMLHGLYIANPNELPSELIENFKKNYIGDEERWVANVQPWIDVLFYKK